MKRILSVLALVALALPAHAAKVDATSTSASVTLGARTSVLLVNCGAAPAGCISANKVYVKVWRCGETVAAITAIETDERILRLEPGESVSATTLGGYCGISYITAAAETATIKYWAQ